jgi:hypothetical protein
VYESASLYDTKPTERLFYHIDVVSPVGVNPSGGSKTFWQLPGFGTVHFLDHCRLIGNIGDKESGGIIAHIG